MSGPVEPLTLRVLAERLNELAGELPGDPSEIDLAAASGHLAQLSHITCSATAYIPATLGSEYPVPLPEREVIRQLTTAMVDMADAQKSLTAALAHTAHGYRTAAIPGAERSHLRGDETTSRAIAADLYIHARGQLERAVAKLPTNPRPAAPQASPAMPPASALPHPGRPQ
nr:hypothetical protein OH826_19855 [Streptomyces sp. NBC_00899]